MSSLRHVQVYDVARTAHFERIVQAGSSTKVLYSDSRYDFDASLATRVGARRVGALGAFWYALRNDIDVLEIAEPLVVRAAPRSCAVVAGARIRARVRRGRVSIVSYAIENKDPHEGLRSLPVLSRWKWCLQHLFVRPVWASLDRVAFGTPQACSLYLRLFGPPAGEGRLVPALPVADLDDAGTESRPPTVAFLGEFSERKGFPLLLQAWPVVKKSVPDARLLLIGKGAGEGDARALADRDEAVAVAVDPPRTRIFQLLAESKVLAFASQPRPRWREQVGLPIVEALGKGCIIATTAETGLAPWLQANGHTVIPAPGNAEEFAGAIVQALRSTLRPIDIVSRLPPRDGRQEAELWLTYQDGER